MKMVKVLDINIYPNTMPKENIKTYFDMYIQLI